MGRLTNADDLPHLLQQAAAVSDASGAVIWMAAGEELFAAAAFGYPPQVIQKLGPINRSAINATAAAWRTSTLQAVTGGRTVGVLWLRRCSARIDVLVCSQSNWASVMTATLDGALSR